MNTEPNASELFGRIAAELNAKFARTFQQQRDNTGWGVLTMPDGVQLFLRFGGYGNEGRINISGSYPSYTDAKGTQHTVTPRDVYVNNERLPSPEISVRMNRLTLTIKKEIENRLLTKLGLREVWLACKARADASTASYDAQREAVERLSRLTGGEVRDGFKSISYGYELGDATYHGWSDARGTFELTLRNVSQEELVALIHTAKQQRGLIG